MEKDAVGIKLVKYISDHGRMGKGMVRERA